MEKMNYVSTSKLRNILAESLKDNRVKIKDRTKEVFFEAFSKHLVLTEGVKENLSKLVDSVMFFFKNVKANNERVDVLINIAKKVYGGGLNFSNLPAFNSALSMLVKKNIQGDRLKEFMKLWMEYLLIDYKGISPLLTFGKELNGLELFLNGLRSNKTLQGINENVDQILSEHGLIYVLKKLSNELIDEAEKLHLATPAESPVNPKLNTSGLIKDVRFPSKLNKGLDVPDHTIDLQSYRERLMSPIKDNKNRALSYEAVFSSFLTILG